MQIEPYPHSHLGSTSVTAQHFPTLAGYLGEREALEPTEPIANAMINNLLKHQTFLIPINMRYDPRTISVPPYSICGSVLQSQF